MLLCSGCEPPSIEGSTSSAPENLWLPDIHYGKVCPSEPCIYPLPEEQLSIAIMIDIALRTILTREKHGIQPLLLPMD